METRITRSWPRTLVLGSVGLGLVAWAAYLFQEGSGGWGCLVGLIGVLCGAGSVILGGTAPCPECGEPLTYINTFGSTPYNKCGSCAAYIRCESGKAKPIEPDHVADVPQFSITLPKKFVMPGLCCACGAPAARSETVSLGIRLVSGPAALTAREATLSLEVPHCARHQGGAKLDRELPDQKPSVETLVIGVRNDPVNVLKVRSHAFYRAFLEANKS